LNILKEIEGIRQRKNLFKTLKNRPILIHQWKIGHRLNILKEIEGIRQKKNLLKNMSTNLNKKKLLNYQPFFADEIKEEVKNLLQIMSATKYEKML
ncbi:MAG: hypothetical protein C5B52_01440, partial [Bacteroidetes bacterium]